MTAMKSASKRVILSLLDEKISSIEEDTQAYAQLIVGAESIADHLSLSIIEEMDQQWVLAVVGVLGQLKQEAHLPYLKRVISYSTEQVLDDLKQMMVISMHTAEEHLH